MWKVFYWNIRLQFDFHLDQINLQYSICVFIARFSVRAAMEVAVFRHTLRISTASVIPIEIFVFIKTLLFGSLRWKAGLRTRSIFIRVQPILASSSSLNFFEFKFVKNTTFTFRLSRFLFIHMLFSRLPPQKQMNAISIYTTWSTKNISFRQFFYL